MVSLKSRVLAIQSSRDPAQNAALRRGMEGNTFLSLDQTTLEAYRIGLDNHFGGYGISDFIRSEQIIEGPEKIYLQTLRGFLDTMRVYSSQRHTSPNTDYKKSQIEEVMERLAESRFDDRSSYLYYVRGRIIALNVLEMRDEEQLPLNSSLKEEIAEIKAVREKLYSQAQNFGYSKDEIGNEIPYEFSQQVMKKLQFFRWMHEQGKNRG